MAHVPIRIHLGAVVLNNVDHYGSVSLGTAIKIGRNVAAKKNQGFGQQFADGVIRTGMRTATFDDEPLDVASWKINR